MAQQADIGGNLGGEAGRRQANHRVADGEPDRVAADRRDDAGAFAAERARIAGIRAERVQHVAEIEARGAHLDTRLAGSWRCRGDVAQAEVFERAAFGNLQTEWPIGRREPSLGTCPCCAGHQPGRVPLTGAEGHLILAVRGQ